MTHPILSDAQIKRRKKIQGNISIAGGTLGLTALGLRGAGAARGAGKVGRTVQRLTKLTPDAAKAEKFKDASTAVTTAGAGLGGVGAFNFASYTKAEARKRTSPVVKGFSMLDFGISGTTEVSKAMPMPKVPGVKAPMAAGMKKPMSPMNVKPMQMPKPGAFGQATSTYRQPGPGAPTGKTLPGAQAGRHRAPGGMLSRLSGGQKAGMAGAGGLMAGGGGMAMLRQPQQPTQPKKPVVKARDGQNIMEHQRRARDSRRTYKRGEAVAGLGGAALVGAATLGHAKGVNVGRQAMKVGRAVKGATQLHLHPSTPKGWRGMARKTTVSIARENPYGATALGGATAMGGGYATMAGARANEKRHDRAVSQLRRNRVKKSDDLVFKAYDPERNRQQRLDRYATGASMAAGAAGAGSLTHARFAGSHYMRARKAENNVVQAGKNAGKNAPKAAAALREYKMAAGHGARAAGFGAAAIGAAVASDRIRSYKKGKGRTYGQLRMIGN